MRDTSMSRPLVSIITPAYNSSAFIEETITSVLAQTFSDFEMLIVDDGSTDNTLDVVAKATKGDSRFVVLHSPHSGPAGARNVAMKAARGQFMTLLDSDDVWLPTYLSWQFEAFKAFPGIDIVSSNAISRGGPLDGRPLWAETSGYREVTLRDVITDDQAVLVMSIMRRDVFQRIDGFDLRFNGNEDYEFWIRAANAGFRILQNRRPLVLYRRRAGSLSADEIRMLHGMIAVIEASARLPGPIQNEADAIARQLQHLREEVLRITMRSSFAKRDGAAAAKSLKALSELRKSRGLAVAARLAMAWPDLLQWAYGLRQSLRAS